MNICLIGPHGAGKTTLGQLLAPSLGASFRDEYGRTLREAWLSEDPDATALRFDEAFDRAVIEGDLARDAERWGPVCVMETWHPGNFAYAEVRSPEVARSFEARARRQVDALARRGLGGLRLILGSRALLDCHDLGKGWRAKRRHNADQNGDRNSGAQLTV